ncbi:hypothetical protein BESB_037550 [Besnoitia besnoiti]|uniref:Uncharacterized protein n=1 Tax=Besnoitia besnoiti TaxID=94643 RepID=A0A2A9MN82_BESBE|nr:hypothetical protein BESB_037550 [Besnoitia besnoiti]PFH37297.1 hypothetical protein BESB_037550 [Besnoitia besnoiti]
MGGGARVGSAAGVRTPAADTEDGFLVEFNRSDDLPEFLQDLANECKASGSPTSSAFAGAAAGQSFSKGRRRRVGAGATEKDERAPPPIVGFSALTQAASALVKNLAHRQKKAARREKERERDIALGAQDAGGKETADTDDDDDEFGSRASFVKATLSQRSQRAQELLKKSEARGTAAKAAGATKATAADKLQRQNQVGTLEDAKRRKKKKQTGAPGETIQSGAGEKKGTAKEDGEEASTEDRTGGSAAADRVAVKDKDRHDDQTDRKKRKRETGREPEATPSARTESPEECEKKHASKQKKAHILKDRAAEKQTRASPPLPSGSSPSAGGKHRDIDGIGHQGKKTRDKLGAGPQISHHQQSANGEKNRDSQLPHSLPWERSSGKTMQGRTIKIRRAVGTNGEEKARRKTKTRSRQKNIRKDNRPDHMVEFDSVCERGQLPP